MLSCSNGGLGGETVTLGHTGNGSVTDTLIAGKEIFINAAGSTNNVYIQNPLILQLVPTFDSEALAVTGGLATGAVYKTTTGELRIKL